MSISQIPSSTCNHTAMGHMFYHVFCPSQSLLKKVGTVALSCLLLIGLLFAAYSAISTSPRLSFSQSPSHIRDYPPLGKRAIEESTQAIIQFNPPLVPYRFSAGWHSLDKTHQPVNEQIALLTTLYLDTTFKQFKEMIQYHSEYSGDPWNQGEVISAADACMKIAYTISCLTLEDLEPFTQQSKIEPKRTYAQALTSQDSYQYRTFFYCTQVYHCIRGQAVWDSEEKQLSYLEDGIPEPYAQLFYTEGTIQNTWNQLYNDFCSRVRLYVKEEDLKKADTRHINWTKEDTGVETFRQVPDTLPT